MGYKINFLFYNLWHKQNKTKNETKQNKAKQQKLW